MHAKRIILGVTGGIGAYKTPQLVRDLLARGAEITPVMTRGANHFVGAASLQAVSGRRVRGDLWDAEAEAAMGHIELARWADAILIAPATAHVIARLAGGVADDLLTTLCLATSAPLFLAPAMNRQMWQHPAVQRNVGQLRADGATILGPAHGEQACGEVGPGRMLEPAELAEALASHFASGQGALAGLSVLVTAGPTREHIDPVRFISNHSSGKQGYALAAAAAQAGGNVTLVSGPVALEAPPGVKRVSVTTAREMLAAVEAALPGTDIFVGVAAVGDYRPAAPRTRKIKRAEAGSTEVALPLTENPDILATVATSDTPCVVGFAAETHDALGNARQKLARKGCHAIIVNDVSDATIGFDSDENAVTLVTRGGEVVFPRTSKQALAAQLVDAIAAIHHEQCPGEREGFTPRRQEQGEAAQPSRKEPLPRLA